MWHNQTQKGGLCDLELKINSQASSGWIASHSGSRINNILMESTFQIAVVCEAAVLLTHTRTPESHLIMFPFFIFVRALSSVRPNNCHQHLTHESFPSCPTEAERGSTFHSHQWTPNSPAGGK